MDGQGIRQDKVAQDHAKRHSEDNEQGEGVVHLDLFSMFLLGLSGTGRLPVFVQLQNILAQNMYGQQAARHSGGRDEESVEADNAQRGHDLLVRAQLCT